MKFSGLVADGRAAKVYRIGKKPSKIKKASRKHKAMGDQPMMAIGQDKETAPMAVRIR